jgi:2-deoxy-D-gluconate 3-dehydrogenase
MEQNFDGRVAIVTVAASGIGYTVAHHFASRGARVVGVDLSDSVAALMAELPGPGHHGIARDLTAPEAATDVIAEAVRVTGTPHIPVNSAGIALLDSAVDVPAALWQATMDVNLTASFYMAQAAGRQVRPARGSGVPHCLPGK